MADEKFSSAAVDSKRRTLRLSVEDDEKLEYWARKEGYSVNAFIPVLLEQYIGIANGKFTLGGTEYNVTKNDGLSIISGNYISKDGGTTKNYEAIYVDSDKLELLQEVYGLNPVDVE